MKGLCMKVDLARAIVWGALAVGCALQAQPQGFSASGAARYVQAEDWNGLLRYAQSWTRAEPNDPNGWAFLGMDYGLHLHQPAQAAIAIRRSLQLNPNQPDGWEALGVACLDLKQYPDAITAIRRAIQLNPNQYAFWNNLAAAYSDEADWKDAMGTLDQEQPLAARLKNAQVWYVLGNGYLRLENAPKAVPAFQHCVQLQPGLAPCWTNLGVMLEWGGNDQAALQAYARATALGDSLAGQDAGRLKQAMAAQQSAASGGGGGMSPGGMLHSFRQQAVWASEDRSGTPRTDVP
jgi:tetratricopeptide (TPR) repeat protein